ncbi:MAG: ABC transporter ATP-binding protein [Clostridia bacterium]|nr:ABC transporter ATP-binding protein [Clostridia bacterium]
MIQTNSIELRNISKAYGNHTRERLAVKNVTAAFQCGEFTVIAGKSGSGKSTLLNMLSGIDRPTEGEVLHGETRLGDISENELARWRGKNVGIVFQFFQLIPTLTVLENVLLPMDFCNITPAAQRRAKARNLLERMGVIQYADCLPSTISGGEQQRAAVARSLANDPPFIIADEPTGNLDTGNAESIVGLFREMAFEGKGVVMVTHNHEIAAVADRVLQLRNGELVSDERVAGL